MDRARSGARRLACVGLRQRLSPRPPRGQSDGEEDEDAADDRGKGRPGIGCQGGHDDRGGDLSGRQERDRWGGNMTERGVERRFQI